MKEGTAYSVIIPLYNAEKTIWQCLYSIYGQILQPKEVIVIDDGSTDNSVIIVKKFIEDFNYGNTCKIIRQANAGPSAARNAGVILTSTEWLAFLDADDCWHPEKIVIQLQALFEYQASMCGTLTGEFKAGICFSELEFEVAEIYFKNLLFKNYFATSSVLIHKMSLIAAGMFDISRRHSEDYEVWLKICARHKSIRVNLPLVSYGGGKRAFGMQGLSANLGAMQRGELQSYKNLYLAGLISFPTLIVAKAFSIMKYLRRILIAKILKK